MRPVLIVGFHRSGTSAIARAFHGAGLDLGTDLLGAEPANPHGHFEDLDAIALHDSFLASTGRTWKSVDAGEAPLPRSALDQLRSYVERRVSAGRPWGVKDPRLCLYLDEWLRIAPEARVVVVVRRPDETIRSLHMRHSRRHVETRGVDPSDLDFWRDPDLGLKLWVHYHQQTLQALDAARDPYIIDFSDRSAADHAVASLVNRWSLDLDAASIPALDPHLGSRLASPIEVRSVELLHTATDIWARVHERIASQSPRVNPRD